MLHEAKKEGFYEVAEWKFRKKIKITIILLFQAEAQY